jgi:hypothetical protein
MLYRCDRCKQLFDGWEHEDGTTCGFYDVSYGDWARFARPYETVLCDECMWSDPEYVRLYGPTKSSL